MLTAKKKKKRKEKKKEKEKKKNVHIILENVFGTLTQTLLPHATPVLSSVSVDYFCFI